MVRTRTRFDVFFWELACLWQIRCAIDIVAPAGRWARSRVCAANTDAGVAELVDALDLGSSDASRGGSSPFAIQTCFDLVSKP